MIDQHSTLSEKFLKKGFWLYLFSFIIAPITYVIKIIISWELTVSEVGVLYGIISLVIMLSAYNDLWISESLKYFVPQFITEQRYDRVKSILFYALFTQILTSTIIAWFFFLWADYISLHYFRTKEASEILKVFAFFFIWINIFQTISQFYLAVQNTKYHKIIEVVRILFTMISVLFIFLWDLWSLLNYSYTWLIWLYLWTLVSIIIIYKTYYKNYFLWENIIFDKKFMLRIFKYAWLVFIWSSAWTLLWQIDMQMIIYLLWTKQAWYYTNYISIIWIPFILIWPILGLLFPIFSEMHSKWEDSKIKLIKSVFQKNFLAVWIALNILFFIFAEVIAYILFWEKFINSWTILKYSILLLAFNFLFQINFNIMSWIWKISDRIKIICIAVIFNIITNLIFINLIWVYWAALATWLGWVLIWILSEYYLWNKFSIKFDYKFIWKNLFIMWFLWIFFNYYVIDIFEWLWRLMSLWIMSLIWFIWFLLFLILNIKEFKFFIWEIKKLKK